MLKEIERYKVKIYVDVFITGITLSWGPCLSFCTPLLLPYIAATQKGWFSGLKATLAFSLARIASYALLSLFSALLGQSLLRTFYESNVRLVIYILASFFILLLGMIILIGKYPRPHICQFLSKQVGSESLKGMVLLGMFVGIMPCMPLLGVLTYIAFTSQNILEGVGLGLIFGLGTLISPLILFGPFASVISSLLFKKPLVYKIFNRICGLILIYLGMGMIIRMVI